MHKSMLSLLFRSNPLELQVSSDPQGDTQLCTHCSFSMLTPTPHTRMISTHPHLKCKFPRPDFNSSFRIAKYYLMHTRNIDSTPTLHSLLFYFSFASSLIFSLQTGNITNTKCGASMWLYLVRDPLLSVCYMLVHSVLWLCYVIYFFLVSNTEEKNTHVQK